MLGWLANQPYLLLSLTSLFWAGNIVLGRFVAGQHNRIGLRGGVEQFAPSFQAPAVGAEENGNVRLDTFGEMTERDGFSQV